jgi:hypothetical protein
MHAGACACASTTCVCTRMRVRLSMRGCIHASMCAPGGLCEGVPTPMDSRPRRPARTRDETKPRPRQAALAHGHACAPCPSPACKPAHLDAQLPPLPRARVLNGYHQLGLVDRHVPVGLQRPQERHHLSAVRLGLLGLGFGGCSGVGCMVGALHGGGKVCVCTCVCVCVWAHVCVREFVCVCICVCVHVCDVEGCHRCGCVRKRSSAYEAGFGRRGSRCRSTREQGGFTARVCQGQARVCVPARMHAWSRERARGPCACRGLCCAGAVTTACAAHADPTASAAHAAQASPPPLTPDQRR